MRVKKGNEKARPHIKDKLFSFIVTDALEAVKAHNERTSKCPNPGALVIPILALRGNSQRMARAHLAHLPNLAGTYIAIITSPTATD